VALLAISVVVAGACASGGPTRSSTAAPRADAVHDDAITVGSFDFAESSVVAELYAEALEDAGFAVHRDFDLGSRELVGPSLVAGLVEVVPEYAGTALQFHSLGTVAGSSDAVATHAALDAVLRKRGLAALAASPAQDANTFVVTRSTAARLSLASLTDVAPVSGTLRFGGPSECPSRPLCLVGLRRSYGIDFGDHFVRLDTGGPVTRQALADGLVDVALLFTTDPSLAAGGDLVELSDDRGLQPAENITPVVHRSVVDHFGERAVAALDRVSAAMTTADVRSLNDSMRQPGASLASVAHAWLTAEGLVD
jgi:osmoprotectant transport system substrate-binding protein